MKKLILSLCLVGLLIGFAPIIHADTIPATTDDIASLKQELITLLQQVIAQLQAQIDAISAQQNSLQSTVQEQGQSIDKIQQSAQPVASSASQLPLFQFTPQLYSDAKDVGMSLDMPIKSDNCSLIVTDQTGKVWRDSNQWSLDKNGNQRQIVSNNQNDTNQSVDNINNTYSYKVTCSKTGYQDNTQTGTFPLFPSN